MSRPPGSGPESGPAGRPGKGEDAPPRGLAILGGSFNPPHVGHFRLAVEIREELGPLAEKVVMLPCARPPHKDAGSFLPFGMRADMVEAVAAGLPDVVCDRREDLRRGPSYTWDTLGEFREELPGWRIFFVIGGEDYQILSSWRNGLHLLERCDMVVVPRGRYGVDEFRAATMRLWPHARPCPPLTPRMPGMRVIGGTEESRSGGAAYFLRTPWLEISASSIRERWLRGLNTDFLMPDTVARMLRAQAPLVRTHWLRTEGQHAEDAT